MPTILVVGESTPGHDQIDKLLTSQDYTVFQAEGAERALEEMGEHSPDLVILDLQSSADPNLELVSELRRHYPYVPVVLITSGSNPRIAIDALRRGASSYVPRRGIQHELLPTIRNLLNLVAPRRSRSELAEVMESCSYNFCLPNSYSLVAALVGFLEQVMRDLGTCGESDCVRVSVALLEALSNALYHGNLELDSRLREEDFDAYRRAAEERSQMIPYSERRIFVECSLSKERAFFVVRDEGQGFDPQSIPLLPEGPNLDRVSGRGIMLMKTMMDEVIFNETGNQVTLIRYRHPAEAE